MKLNNKKSTLIFSAIVLIAIIFINLIGRNVFKRFDLTDNKMYSLSSSSKSVVSKIDDIFIIKVPLRNLGMIGSLYAEYRYSSLIIKTLKRNQDLSLDSVICLSPSIFYGKAIDWIKKEYSIKTYLVCRDIFPKWAVDSGLLRKGLLYCYFKFIENIDTKGRVDSFS